MKKVILFDFGRVLGSETDVLVIDNEVSEMTGLSKGSLQEIFDECWTLLKIGEKDLDDYHGAIAKRSLKLISTEELRTLHREKIWVNTEMLDFAKELKKQGNRIMILSNESRQGMEDKKNKFLLPEIFEKIYTSAEIGLAKPNTEIFAYVIKDLKVEPNSIIFIDDWDQNIASAKSLGMEAIQYIDVEQLKKELVL